VSPVGSLECPETFDVEFGRRLVAHLGGDASKVKDGWCWEKFAAAFPELCSAAEGFFAAAQTGDPAWVAYRMSCDCGSSREWAEKIIAAAKTGNPAWVAYRMSCVCGSSREWAEKVTNPPAPKPKKGGGA